MMNFLESWQKYLLQNVSKFQKAEDLGDLYEDFIAQFPDLRKEFGVYYTPQYIVDYMVENTLGKMIADKNPQEIAKIKILDPSCGSGSFLLGAYRFLLNFYQKYYFKIKESGKKVKELTPENLLTTSVKKQILLDNIFGVDIDTQAVEVTKLSLLIKCLEGETPATVAEQNQLFKQRVLPSLERNILDGNSLIAHDFYENSLFLTPKERRKINTFDWYETEKGFANIFKNGGFDIIMGNPPYVDYRILTDAQASYIQKKFISTAVPEKWNLYVPFIELGSKLLKKGGLFGYIVPNSFLAANFGLQLRKLLLGNTQIREILDVSKLKVFGNVATYPILILFKNEFQQENLIKIAYPKNFEEFQNPDFEHIAQEKLNNEKTQYLISTAFSNQGMTLIDKIEENTSPLKNFYGKFIWGTSISGFKSHKIKESDYKKLSQKAKALYAKVIQTADIKKYALVWKKEYIKIEIYSENGKREFAKEKIVIARVTKKIQATFDKEGYFFGKSSLLTDLKANPLFLLAIINSAVANYFYAIKFENTHMAGGYLRFDIPYLAQIPIPNIDFQDKKQKDLHDKIVKKAEDLLLLNQQLQTLKIDSDKKNTIQLIRYSNKEMNKLVFSLFRLDSADIELINKQLGEE